MILVEETTPPDAVLPVAALRSHLRLGSGFELAETADEDRALAGFLRAAISAIEGRTGKVLLRRAYRMVIGGWRDPAAQALPMAPVSAVQSVEIQQGGDQPRALPPDRWVLVDDIMRPVIRPRGGAWPVMPQGSCVVICFTAGFSENWEGVPADLAQAVLMLATRYYEDRGDQSARHAFPMGVSALIERWRAVRVLAGRGAR
ncbi:head-tail connector protein [Paracoccus aerodenitrificans]|uniref:head-tail connector protein n=1 Tax=Paracoccus aerodenitrificans TaxID=3017781 RepID=UPI0022F07A7A|nr:hypothetical protein [Paracoccus aerodenitrificans]WBU65338.1 hypothetical protein PAE61_07960 [Paracoccus aerodenitrificans]